MYRISFCLITKPTKLRLITGTEEEHLPTNVASMEWCNTCAISHNATVLMNNTLDHQYTIGPRGGTRPQWPLDPPLSSVPLNSEVDPEQLNIFKTSFRLTIDRK